MLHRFLARARVWVTVVVWQVAVGACHAASVCWVSISVWTFAFRVRFVGILSAVEWSMKRGRERKRESCLWCLASRSVRIAPWSYRLWCLSVCLSVPAPKSQFFPSFPFLLLVLLPFLVRFVFVSPSQFCWLWLRLCCVFLVAAVFPVLSRSCFSSCNQKSIIDAFGPKTLWGQPHLCIEPETKTKWDWTIAAALKWLIILTLFRV